MTVEHEIPGKTFIQVRHDNYLVIRDIVGNELSAIEPEYEDDPSGDLDFSINRGTTDYSGTVDYNGVQIPNKELKIGTSNWSIWYPNVKYSDLILTDDGEELVAPEDEDVELVFTFKGQVQMLTIPTITGEDTMNVSNDSLVLGYLWAIQPRNGGLTFFFRYRIDEMYEAQVDITTAGYLSKITEARYLSSVSVYFFLIKESI